MLLFPNIEERMVGSKDGPYNAGALGLIDGGLRMLDEVIERLKPWPEIAGTNR